MIYKMVRSSDPDEMAYYESSQEAHDVNTT